MYLLPFPKAKESWREIHADLNNTDIWVNFYLQENDTVLEWWKEFQSHIGFLVKASALSWSKEWPASKPLPLGCWLHNKHAMAHGLLHPAWCHWGKGTTFPDQTLGSLGLLSGAGWRDSGIDQGSPKMCCPFWDASGVALWSSAGTSWMPPPWFRVVTWLTLKC